MKEIWLRSVLRFVRPAKATSWAPWFLIAHVIIHATQVGTFQSIPPTGKRIALEAISIMRMEHDQLVEHWECSDIRGLLRQVGAKIVQEKGTED